MAFRLFGFCGFYVGFCGFYVGLRGFLRLFISHPLHSQFLSVCLCGFMRLLRLWLFACIPTSFKLSKNDKKMNIDKHKDSINLETDVHNITFKWGRHTSPSDNGENETQETIREMMKK